ncbi:hypothetical protein [Sulfitobacter sabulilitoris]|uniref:Uncharacterized protein n=1 Tax=Sulfitobacter sabulilitoris TaxID=2562655 RepID=A0A5S3PCZ9_9RHOB|nr:hypothetical protein [Sulfitobacter sabulilitoris]TMM51638.1 hypothetical protein FDT80_12830 [Sulfitobacter sabulilitoris]
MSLQPEFPGLFSHRQGAEAVEPALPPTHKQMLYARQLALRTGDAMPGATDRAALSKWIEAHRPKVPEGRFTSYPSSRQVAFAERIARIKRRDIPRECFQDKTLMARWIDGNKPR